MNRLDIGPKVEDEIVVRGHLYAIIVSLMLIASANATIMGFGSNNSDMPLLKMSEVFEENEVQNGNIQLPTHFSENLGQIDNPEIHYSGTIENLKVGFGANGVLLNLEEEDERRLMIRIDFEGSNGQPPEGRDELPHTTNSFIGNDPANWFTGIRSFKEIVYEKLYEGIDAVYRADDKGLKYEFRVAPGSDPSRIALEYEGIEYLEIDEEGGLSVHTSAGTLKDSAPYSYTESGIEVECRYVLKSGVSLGFECKDWEGTSPLTIDPLIYSTYHGGSADDTGASIRVDANGYAYIVGWTDSTDFPTTPGAYDNSPNGSRDAFVAKIDQDGGSLVYSTYLGGSNEDMGIYHSIDSNGCVYLTGYTYSFNFPTTPGAYSTSHSGGVGNDVFVAKLNATGDGLEYSTYLGGTNWESTRGITVDSSGNAYITGYTISDNFPVTPGSYDTTYNGGLPFGDAFVTKLNATGTGLLYSTYLGDGGNDYGTSIVVDEFDRAYLTGWTTSFVFPTTPGAMDTTHNGGVMWSGVDAFITKLNETGDGLLYSTYLGGDGDDWGNSIVLDSNGNIFTAGNTSSSNFPTTPNALKAVAENYDAYVTILNASGGGLDYSTLLGGVNVDSANHIALGVSDRIHLTGSTQSGDFPTTKGALSETMGGPSDSYVIKFNSTNTGILYSTFLGGTDGEAGNSIAVDLNGDAYITGSTVSLNFPVTPGAYNTTHSGLRDSFVSKLWFAYVITVDTSPSGLVYTLNSIPYVTPHTFWCTAGETLYLNISTPQGGGQTRFLFGNWSHGAPQNHSLTCEESASYIAVFTMEHYVAFFTWPIGLDVDGVPYPPPFPSSWPTFDGWWKHNTSHTINVTNPVGEIPNDTKFIFSEWDDFGPRNRTWIVDGPIELHAYFDIEYWLEMICGPGCTPWSGYQPAGSKVTIADSFFPPPGGNGTFIGWTGIGAGSYTGPENPCVDCVVMNGSNTEISNGWQLQWQVTFDTVPSGIPLEVNGQLIFTPHTMWLNDSEMYTVKAPSIFTGFPRVRYVWSGWSDGGQQNHTLFVTAPTNFTAYFNIEYLLIVDTNQIGLEVNVNGINYTAPHSFWCRENSTHWLEAPSPQMFGLTRYAFTNWSDGGARTHPITCIEPKDYIANFSTQYYVNIAAGPMVPPLFEIIVDGMSYPSPYISWWTRHELHTVNISTYHVIGSSRYGFLGWSDFGPQNRTINVTGPLVISADFYLQYQIIVDTIPTGLVVEIDAIGYSTPWKFWCDGGSVRIFNALDPITLGSIRYRFVNWTDGDLQQTKNVVCDAPRLITATYSPEYLVTIDTLPPGLMVMFDTIQKTAPYTYWCPADSQHTLDISSPQVIGENRYIFKDWSDGGAQMHTITCTAPENYTASFEVQHLVSIYTLPSGLQIELDAGSFQTPYSFWCNSGSTHTLNVPSPQVSGSFRYSFATWSSGASQVHDVTCIEPTSHTADFNTQYKVIVTTELGIDVTVDGGVYGSPYTSWWFESEAHVITVVSIHSYSWGERAVWQSWSDGGDQEHTVSVTSPTTFTAYFSMQYLMTVDSAPTSLQLEVDGGIVNAPYATWVAAQSLHTLKAPTPQVVGDITYSFGRWSDSGGPSHTITVASPTNYTAEYVMNMTVDAKAIPLTGDAPLRVFFEIWIFGGSRPFTYEWDFGDGETAHGSSPMHIYSEPGTYTVTVHVIDSATPQGAGTDTIQITVERPAEQLLDVYIWWILAILIIGVALAIIALLWFRRRKDNEAEEPGPDEEEGAEEEKTATGVKR